VCAASMRKNDFYDYNISMAILLVFSTEKSEAEHLFLFC